MGISRFLRPVQSDEANGKPFSKVPEDASIKPQLCEVDVPEQDISDLRTLVKMARLPPETFENVQSKPNTKYGLTRDWIKNAIETWTNESTFSWTKAQNHINSVPHFTSQVDYEGHSYSVHFIALFSNRPDAVPVVNIHGWPGCFLEFIPIMNLLQQKYTPDTLPYHFIAPSMPGYTLSSGPPTDRDFSTLDVSRIFQDIFKQLGFDKTTYIVSAGDIGSRVARGLAVDDRSCLGIHLNFGFDGNMYDYPREGLTTEELNTLAAADDFMKTGIGYSMMHASRSATIGIILASNPVALLAWIGEKLVTWTDDTPSLDTILTFITVYWLTETFPRSIFPYRADFALSDPIPSHGSPHWRIPEGKPFGFSSFPGELIAIPRAWAERTGKVTFWKDHDKGGHFAALEEPQAMLEDLEQFVSQVIAK